MADKDSSSNDSSSMDEVSDAAQPLTRPEEKAANGDAKIDIEDRVVLKKQVTLINGIALIVGVMIGSGIFISPKGVLVRTGSIASSLFVWGGCGLLALMGSLCYCEMGTMIPRSGGEYAYLQEAFGPLPAFIFSWTLALVIRPSSMTIVALTFARYVSQPFYPDCDISPMVVRKVLAAACLGLTCFINCASVKWATRIQDTFTFAKLLAIAILTAIGVIELARGKLEHFENSFEGTTENPADIGLAFYAGLWAYDGWNNLNFVTEELKNPARDLPRALMIGIPLVTVCYLMTNIAYITVVGKAGILTSGAVAMSVGDQMLGVMSWIIPIFVACSTFGCVNGLGFSGARLVFVSAREGHFPQILSSIQKTRSTPMAAICFMYLIAIVMLIPDSASFSTLVNYFSFSAWLSYFSIFAALLYLRWKRPHADRPYKVWIIIPIAVAICSLYLLITPFAKEPFECSLAAFFILCGVPVYFLLIRMNLAQKCCGTCLENFNFTLLKIFGFTYEEKPEDILMEG